MGSNKHGKGAQDIELKVPLGTIIKDADTGEILADIVKDNQRYIIARGGKGGRGNARFASATHRSPREWEVGKKGEERWIELELKMIADIGLVGLPNAGKSTLLSRISAARPKIADYPFTTLQPNLGIVEYYEYNTFVVADIPGLIEGAHEGKGLGHQFLRHIERTRALAYVIDITEDNPIEVYETLKSELKSFSKILTKKPAMVVLTKTDLNIEENIINEDIFKLPVLKISSITGEHISELKKGFYNLIQEALQIEESYQE
jgi:GTP-binding protein